MQKTIPLKLIVHPIIESLELIDQGHYLRFVMLMIRNRWQLPTQVLNFWPQGRIILEQLPELYSIEDDQITAIHGHHVRQMRQKAAQKRFAKNIKNEDLHCKSHAKNQCESVIPVPKKIKPTSKPKKIMFELPSIHLELFKKFWEAYPRKVSKQTCKVIWEKLGPDRDLVEKMLATLEWQRETKEWIEGYIPHPSTWLNGHRWEDEPPEDLKMWEIDG